MSSKYRREHSCRTAISINLIFFRHGCYPVNLLQIAKKDGFQLVSLDLSNIFDQYRMVHHQNLRGLEDIQVRWYTTLTVSRKFFNRN